MNKTPLIVLGLIAVVLLAGCIQPPVNDNDTGNNLDEGQKILDDLQEGNFPDNEFNQNPELPEKNLGKGEDLIDERSDLQQELDEINDLLVGLSDNGFDLGNDLELDIIDPFDNNPELP
ncbi:MAG: hypothetical protein ABH821_04005 [archaeon]